MPVITGHLDHNGAVLAVLVGVSGNRQAALERVNLPVPPRVLARAQIDTGSFTSAFLPQVFERLQVEPFDKILIGTPSTKPGEPHRCNVYDVSVTLVSESGDFTVPSVHAIMVADFDEETEGGHALLGRDVLDRCTFKYMGPGRSFSLTFL